MLDIDDLKVALDAEAGLVRAIDGLRLAIERGETFALVGEVGLRQEHDGAGADAAAARERPHHRRRASRSTARTCWRCPSRRCARMRGGRIGMIFQEPATSLNPVMRVGDQIVEAIETHTPLRGAAARAKAIDWLRARRHPRARAAHRRVPVPHERRPEAARDDRDDAGRRARLPDRRRADDRARRHDPGADPRPAARPAARAGHGPAADHARPRRGVRHGAPRGADVRRADHRGGASADEFFAAPKHPYAQRAVARAARRRPARRAAGGDRRHRAAADADLRRLPLRAALCQRDGALREHAARAARCSAPTHSVRCLLYARRRLAPRQRRRRGRRRAAGGCARPARGSAARRRCSRCRTCACASRSARACCSAPRATSTRSTACPSRSRPARRWRWSANRAAARRPSARPSCSCCAARPTSTAGRCSAAATCSSCRAMRCRRRGATSRSSSRTRSRR